MFALPFAPDSILLATGQILTAPPESDPTPDTGTTPACLCHTDSLSLAEQVQSIDGADLLQWQLEADAARRTELRAQIALWQCQEEDGSHCGMSLCFRAEIEAARAEIDQLNENLFCYDLRAELCA